MWTNQFKIAIVQRDTDTLSDLMNNLPKLEDKKEIEQVIFLLKEATNLVQGLKDDTQTSMIQMKKNINFLEATQASSTSTLDIKS